MNIIYLGDTGRLEFTAQLEDGTPADLTGAKLWVAVKATRTTADPPLISKRNVAAGGAAGEVVVDDPLTGAFLGVLPPADTDDLVHDGYYVADGIVQLADGTVGVAGTVEFRARHRVLRALPP